VEAILPQEILNFCPFEEIWIIYVLDLSLSLEHPARAAGAAAAAGPKSRRLPGF